MDATQKQIVMQYWNSTLSIYGRAPINDAVTSEIILDAFEGYTTTDVSKAIKEYVKTGTSYAPTPAQIVEIINRQNGLSDEELARKADTIYCEMKSNCNSANDWIIADLRACVAVSKIYSSPQEYAKTSFTDYQEEKKRQAFIDAYCKASRLEAMNAKHVFSGFYANTDDPIVSFLGDYQKCLAIAKEHYRGRHPRLPQDPTTVKSLPKPEDRPLTPEEREYSKQMMSKALAILGNIKLRGRTC